MKKEEIMFHISEWQMSGKSKLSYCREHQIVYHRFIYYSSMGAKVSTPRGFIELNIDTGVTDTVEYHLPSGGYFRFRSGCSISVIKAIVDLC